MLRESTQWCGEKNSFPQVYSDTPIEPGIVVAKKSDAPIILCVEFHPIPFALRTGAADEAARSRVAASDDGVNTDEKHECWPTDNNSASCGLRADV